MISLKTIVEVRNWAQQQKSSGRAVHLVPTMGYFHEGHLSLMRRAKEKDSAVIVSLFVNPTQFGQNEDLARYPRDLERDKSMAESAGADALFVPNVQEIYPPGFQTTVSVPLLNYILCGRSRPTHFDGVAVVVLKLFNIVQPDRAYFGMKDYQQMTLIRQMVQDLNLTVEIIPCPIVREPDGLAMSSRNVYLNPEQRQAATVLSRSLQWAQAQVDAGEHDMHRLREGVLDMIQSEPLAHIDYVEIVHAETLEPLETIMDSALLALAVYFDQTRLIDNLLLKVSGSSLWSRASS
jgi:pantoate--beta-alanine ligase